MTYRLIHSDRLGRQIRLDPPEQLGVPTQDLIDAAIDGARWTEARELLDYMRQESDRLNATVLGGWLTSLTAYAQDRLGHPQMKLLLRTPAGDLLRSYEDLAHLHHADAQAHLAAGDAASAKRAVDHLRVAYKTLNDVVVRWIQDILTALADAFGEDEPARAMRPAFDQIWRERYRTWDDLTPHEQLALSAEGMRAHFGGPTRRGEFQVVEESDRFTMSFDPCGTGGVLRRGDPELGTGPYATTGVSSTPRSDTWGKQGVHWYCSHCTLYLERFPALDDGRIVRPLSHDLDHDAPCVWHVYKGRERIRAEHYDAIGVPAPAGAPRGDA